MHTINSPIAMRQFGKNFAKEIAANPPKTGEGAFVIALHGNLGAGKTQFAQGFAKGLGIGRNISSPTYTIVKSYPIKKNKKNIPPRFLNFFHLDCYRLKNISEAGVIGIGSIFENINNIVLIEWPCAIKKILPAGAVWLDFIISGEKQREVIVRNCQIKVDSKI